MRNQGSGWRGSDADEKDDVGRGDHARGMLTARSSDPWSDFRRQIAGGAVRVQSGADVLESWVIWMIWSGEISSGPEPGAALWDNRCCYGRMDNP